MRGVARVPPAGGHAASSSSVSRPSDLFWINLTAAKAEETRSRWLQHPDFRRVVSHSIDRQAFVDTVYLGAAVPAYGVVSPGNVDWYVDAPAPRYDIEAAQRLLTSLNFADRDHDGQLDDADGAAVHFTLLTQKGNTSLERGASVIRDSLAHVDVRVDVVGVEVGALMQSVLSGQYDAAYFRLLTTDTDPALNADFWLSSAAHISGIQSNGRPPPHGNPTSTD